MSQSLSVYRLRHCIISAAQFSGGGELTFYSTYGELVANDGQGQYTTPLLIDYELLTHFRVVKAEKRMRITTTHETVQKWADQNGFGSQLDAFQQDASQANHADKSECNILLELYSSDDMGHFLSTIAPIVAACRRMRSTSRISMTEPLPICFNYVPDPSYSHVEDASAPTKADEPSDGDTCSAASHVSAAEPSHPPQPQKTNSDSSLSPTKAAATAVEKRQMSESAAPERNAETLSECMAGLVRAEETMHLSCHAPLQRRAETVPSFLAPLNGQTMSKKTLDGPAIIRSEVPSPSVLSTVSCVPLSKGRKPTGHAAERGRRKRKTHLCRSAEQSESRPTPAALPQVRPSPSNKSSHTDDVRVADLLRACRACPLTDGTDYDTTEMKRKDGQPPKSARDDHQTKQEDAFNLADVITAPQQAHNLSATGCRPASAALPTMKEVLAGIFPYTIKSQKKRGRPSIRKTDDSIPSKPKLTKRKKAEPAQATTGTSNPPLRLMPSLTIFDKPTVLAVAQAVQKPEAAATLCNRAPCSTLLVKDDNENEQSAAREVSRHTLAAVSPQEMALAGLKLRVAPPLPLEGPVSLSAEEHVHTPHCAAPHEPEGQAFETHSMETFSSSRKERTRRIMRYLNSISCTLNTLREYEENLRGLFLAMMDDGQL